MVIGLTWAWWAFVYNSPKHIFQAMLDNSLNTYGVTKSVTQKDQNGTLEQVSQAQFGARNLVDTHTTITQPSEGGDTKVKTQTIGTATDNFLRYSSIEVPASGEAESKDFSSITGTWGKQTVADSQQSAFSEMLFGAVLLGYVPASQRQELMDMINSKNIYSVDYSKVEHKKEDGKSFIVYPVSINTKAYVELLQRYDEMLGLKLMSQLDVSQYEDSPPITVKLHVDKTSRNLLRVEYDDQSRDERLSGYGIQPNLDLPTDTVSQEELQAKLETVLYGQ